MRLGVFGGSFDPVHVGHLRLARACREQAALDRVWFVPAATQPHKPSGPVASGADRLAMLRLALDGRAGLEASSIELDRGGVSYTAETLRQIAAAEPEAELFFLMGADTLRDLPNWREPGEVLRLATPLVVHRPGEPPPDVSALAPLVSEARFAEIAAAASVEMPPMDISSSDIRARLGAGEPCDGRLPPAVESYAIARGVYSVG